ncbi:MAG TPA: hypothetical protein VLC47_03825 [Burkholderiales bacterium]|nr:hypothetical protein [Burkholderiales bacterium]
MPAGIVGVLVVLLVFLWAFGSI